jgi:hypothetical protein
VECKQQLMIWSSKIGGKEKMVAVKKKLKWVQKSRGSEDPEMIKKLKKCLDGG